MIKIQKRSANLKYIQIGTRVVVRDKEYDHFQLGTGYGTIVAFNPYHPNECVDVFFDTGKTVCNVQIKHCEVIDFDRVS